MGFLQSIKALNSREQFRPGIFSIIFNPFYINRRAIHTGISKFAPELKGDLLDFGCGTKPYKDLFVVDKYVGIDLDVNEGHSLPRTHVDFFYDGKKLPFKDSEFDSIYTSEVFEHVFNLNEILKDINRVHKQDGLLLITMPFVWQEHEMPNDFGRYTSAGIKSILNDCNYEIVEHVKSPGFYLSIVQLFSAYVHHAVLPRSNSLKFILAPFTIFPINVVGLVLNFFMPRNNDLYINHVILARNIKKV